MNLFQSRISHSLGRDPDRIEGVNPRIDQIRKNGLRAPTLSVSCKRLVAPIPIDPRYAWKAKDWWLAEQVYPLTAPAVRPAINCLAAMKVKMIAGSATRVPMAVMLPHSTPVSVK